MRFISSPHSSRALAVLLPKFPLRPWLVLNLLLSFVSGEERIETFSIRFLMGNCKPGNVMWPLYCCRACRLEFTYVWTAGTAFSGKWLTARFVLFFKNCTASRLKARISFLYLPIMWYLDSWSRSNELFMFLGEKSEAFRITKNNMVALINNERLAKIWNPGNVKLQIRNCKRKNLMLKGSKIRASLIWKICDYFSLHVDYE